MGAAERFSVIPGLLRQAVPHKPLKLDIPPPPIVAGFSRKICLRALTSAQLFLIRSHHPLLLGEAGGRGEETPAFTDGAFLPLLKPS